MITVYRMVWLHPRNVESDEIYIWTYEERKNEKEDDGSTKNVTTVYNVNMVLNVLVHSSDYE